MSDRIAVMNHGRYRAGRRPRGGLRAADDDLRRRLHRRLQPDAGQRPRRQRRPARRVRLDTGVEIEAPGRRLRARASAATPSSGRRSFEIDVRNGRPARDGRPSVEGMVESSVYLGTSTQIVVGLAGDVRMTVLVPNADEAERSAAARRRRRRAPQLGAGAHPRGPGIRRRCNQTDGTRRNVQQARRSPLAVLRRGARCSRRCGRRSRWPATTGEVTDGAEADGRSQRRADDLQLAALHRQATTIPDFEEESGVTVEVHRGRQRQQRVLRQAAAAARPGRVRRAAASSSSPTGWRRRCTTSATCRTSTRAALPNVYKNIAPSLQSPAFDPDRDFSAPWQSGHDRRDRGRHRPGARRDLDQRPLRPPVQGQGRRC